MKEGYFFAFVVLLCVAFLFVVQAAILFFTLPSSTTSLTGHASSQQGRIDLFVESNGSGGTGTTGGSGSSGGSSGGSGGGSGGSSAGSQTQKVEVIPGENGVSQGFEIIPEEINVRGVVGEQLIQEIRVRNVGNQELTIDITASGVLQMSLNKNQVVLGPGTEEVLVLVVEPYEVGVFGGKIVFETLTARKELLVIANIWTSEALFDVSLTIPEASRTILRGNVVRALIALDQVGPAFGVNVTANYIVKDFAGDTLFRESETLFVEQTKNFVKEFPTGALGPGEYIAGVEIIYPEGFATASAPFTVIVQRTNYWMILVLIVAFLIVSFVERSIIRLKRKSYLSHTRKREGEKQ